MNSDYINSFIESYLECALWSSTDDDEDPLDDNYDVDNFSESALNEMRKDCINFCKENAQHLTDIDPEQAGHDFWLTRNRHGAGFWDRGLGEVGVILTDAAHVYGSIDLVVSDNTIYC